MQSVGGLFTAIKGVEVTTTAEDEGVDVVKSVDKGVRIGYRGNDDGYTSSCHYRFIIALAQFTGQVFIIAGDADNRLTFGSRILGIDVAEMGLQVESVCHGIGWL